MYFLDNQLVINKNESFLCTATIETVEEPNKFKKS
jgi:hypothetical protein